LIGKDVAGLNLDNGALNDIAPTILHLLKITQPKEMDGKNLIKQNDQ
jgi:bisphosphoglycerate-independent phosphoglycerate mutase (AlkP superfamily)